MRVDADDDALADLSACFRQMVEADATPRALVRLGDPALVVWSNAAFAARCGLGSPTTIGAADAPAAVICDLAGRCGLAPDRIAAEAGQGGLVVVRVAREAAAEAERTLLRAVIDQAPDCIYAKDMEGRFILKNRFDAEFMGAATPDEAIGKTDYDYYPPEVAERTTADDMAVARSGEPVVGKIERLISKDGREYWFNTTKVPLRDAAGRPIGVLGIGRDVTAVRRLQTELEALAERYREAAERAEDALEVKSRFLAAMSHELRTPMNGVLGLAALLDHGPLDDRQRALVRGIRESGALLVSLVDDIMDASRMEAGRLELHPAPFSLARLAHAVRELYGAAAATRRLAFDMRCDEPEAVLRHGDVLRIRQVLNNLIGNAFKFTERGAVSVTAEGRGDFVRLVVRDTGVGMTAEEIDRAFLPFTQVMEGDDRPRGGAGLGLSIVAGIIERMDGQIAVDSARGTGTVFTATLRAPVIAAR